MAAPPPTPRTRLKRHPERGRHDAQTIASILDQALVCHVGFVADGQPFVIPTIHGRDGNRLFLHGSAASRTLRSIGAGTPVCVTATIVDGLVMARSVFSSSMNYRSVMVLGTAREVRDRAEKLLALRAVAEHVIGGRWDEVRSPTTKELRATSVLSVNLDEASAKIRTGPPMDPEEDLELDVWAGVLPLRTVASAAISDPSLRRDLPVSRSVRAAARRLR